MRRVSLEHVDIRVSIHAGNLIIADFVPPKDCSYAPYTSVIEVSRVPVEIAEYIEFMDKIL